MITFLSGFIGVVLVLLIAGIVFREAISEFKK